MKTLYILCALIALTLHLTPAAHGAEPFMVADNESGGQITLFKDEVPDIIQERVPSCIGARMATSTSPSDGRDIFGCWLPTIRTIQIYWIVSKNVRDYPLTAWELVQPRKARPQRQRLDKGAL